MVAFVGVKGSEWRRTGFAYLLAYLKPGKARTRRRISSFMSVAVTMSITASASVGSSRPTKLVSWIGRLFGLASSVFKGGKSSRSPGIPGNVEQACDAMSLPTGDESLPLRNLARLDIVLSLTAGRIP